ncbi:MAG: ABC transporter permease subunit [Clostridia bacterium]|nr:ABC transporter permease subunit [Clostridia bacterium]
MWLRNNPYFKLLPAICVLFFLFFGGILFGFLQSIGLFSFWEDHHFTFRHYLEIFRNYDVLLSFSLSLKISILSTFISSALGLFIIYLLYGLVIKNKTKFAMVMQRIIQFPMLLPYLVVAFLISISLTQSGWISRLLYQFGFIKDMIQFPIIVHDQAGMGIVLAYVWKTTPFIVFMLFPVLLQVKKEWYEVGKVFGADNKKFFWNIVLPMLYKPLKISTFIVFAYTFIAFEIPYMLGVTYPRTLSVLAYEIYSKGELVERPLALALNFTMTLIIIVMSVFIFKSYRAFKK